jgi:hypothetical protein
LPLTNAERQAELKRLREAKLNAACQARWRAKRKAELEQLRLENERLRKAAAKRKSPR